MTAPFETMMRRRIAEAETDACQALDPAFAALRRRDAEALRRMLRAWEDSLTPAGRRAAELGLPTGPFDGGFA